jgi:hypothetical protein
MKHSANNFPSRQHGPGIAQKSRSPSRKPSIRYCVIRAGISPSVQRQLLKFGRSNFISAKGNIFLIAEAVLSLAMLHREFIENAACKIVRYAKAEGFVKPEDHFRLIESLLKAKK